LCRALAHNLDWPAVVRDHFTLCRIQIKSEPERCHETPNQQSLGTGLGRFALTAASYAQWSNPADDVAAYHPSAPLKVSALPPILSGAKLTGENFRYPWQVHVYQQVAKVSSVVYQLPCNCRCDRALGHTSLRSCFEGLHGTECSTCAQEGFLRLPSRRSRQDAGADSGRDRPARVREDRPGQAVERYRPLRFLRQS
jgi:hypothetical protein